VPQLDQQRKSPVILSARIHPTVTRNPLLRTGLPVKLAALGEGALPIGALLLAGEN